MTRHMNKGGEMDIKVNTEENKIEMYELVKELRDRGAEVTVEQAGGGVEIVRARKNGGNVTAGPFCNGYAFNEEIHYGDDGIDEVGDWWGDYEGTVQDLSKAMFFYLNKKGE